jgi:protein-S-isoprenylcysteine O-methyltransferase Ste14
METKPEPMASDTPRNLRAGIAVRAAQVGIMFLVQGMALFLAAGRLSWTWGWTFLGMCLASALINSYFMLRTSPETIVERGQPKEMRSWDKVVAGLGSLSQFLALPVVAGLDVRFGWGKAPGIGWHIAGAVGFAAGLGLFGWAMITNAYFSTAVRIQTDRGQTVCRVGPYRVVRHPGYLGFITQSVAIPLLLGSWWALVPGGLAVALVVIRTWLEDRTLQDELSGYREYAGEVRHRLIPGVW